MMAAYEWALAILVLWSLVSVMVVVWMWVEARRPRTQAELDYDEMERRMDASLETMFGPVDDEDDGEGSAHYMGGVHPWGVSPVDARYWNARLGARSDVSRVDFVDLDDLVGQL